MNSTNIIFLLLMSLTLVACDSSEQPTPAGMIEQQQDPGDNSNSMGNDGSEGETDFLCGNSDHPKVGQVATFITRHHQVAGQALITDNCTIEVTNFSYDGEGPDVLFYGGIDGDYKGTGAGFPLSDNINGRVYDNETLTIQLSSAMYLDQMNGISVWCVDFDVSFGDGLFQ